MQGRVGRALVHVTDQWWRLGDPSSSVDLGPGFQSRRLMEESRVAVEMVVLMDIECDDESGDVMSLALILYWLQDSDGTGTRTDQH